MKRSQHGLSLVELMVGIAVGLLVVAAAVMILTRHLRESRSLLTEAQLMQDLRTTTDLISRDLRRAGYWGAAGSGLALQSQAPQTNPYASLDTAERITYTYSRDAIENQQVDSNEQFGYRLRKGVIEMQIGDSGWQAMTDSSTMAVLRLNVVPQIQEISLASACTRACSADSSTCPPRQQLRSLALKIDAQSTADASVSRSTETQVRLRNDTITGNCS